MNTTQHSPEFSHAVSQLTLREPFFTALFYSMKVVRDDTLTMPDGSPGIACTDGVRLIYRADQFGSKFTAQERTAILVHELLHVILYHPLRRGIRHPVLWNIACDYAVNLLLEEYGFAIGKGWLLDAQYKGMGAEQIYDKLLQDCKPKDQGGQGKGTPEPDSLGGDVVDYDPSAAGNEGKSKAEVERGIGIDTEKALQAAKAAGKMSAGMKRLLGDAQVVKEPWYAHLRRYMTAMHARQYNWARINTRRAVAFGIVSPDMRTETMGKIVVGIDCSGSITFAQLSAMGAHLADIARECNPKSVKVLYFDAKVCFEEEFEGPDYNIQLSPHGGGGTQFEPVFARVEETDTDAQVMLMMTDMYGSFPEGFGVCDTLWVTPTKDANPPFGEVIHADFND